MEKLLSDEFKTDYEEFNNYLNTSGWFVDVDGNPTQEFLKIRNKYFTIALLNELKSDKSILKQYVKDNSHFFKKIFENLDIQTVELIDHTINRLKNDKYPYLPIVNLLINRRICTTEEFMLYNEDMDFDDCINYANYAGNCGYPSL